MTSSPDDGVSASESPSSTEPSRPDLVAHPTGVPSHWAAHRLSRRRLLQGLGGLAGLGVAGGLGWHLADVLTHGHALYTYQSHSGEIVALAWSPDSRRIASSDGGDLHVWDALSGGHLQTFPASAWVESVAWSPDGHYLATGSFDLTVTIWEVTTGHPIVTYRGHQQPQMMSRSLPSNGIGKSPPALVQVPSMLILGIYALAWSPDGTRLLSSGGDNTVQVWQAQTGQTILTFGPTEAWYYGNGAWFPDGQRLLINVQREVQVFDATSGRLLDTFPIGDEGLSGAASLSPSGQELASFQDQVVHLWEVATGRQVLTYRGETPEVVLVAWSPESRRLASTGQGLAVQVWDAASGQTKCIYRGHMGAVQAFFSQVAPPVTAAAPQRDQPATVVHAGLVARRASLLFPHDTNQPLPGISALEWAPNGQYIASGGLDEDLRATVQVWQPG